MTWVRLDDHIDEHPKIAAAGPLGLALFVTSLAYANRNLTDGFVPQSVAARLVTWQAPWGTIAVTTGMEGDDVTSEPVIESLVSLGLWRRVKGGYRIHDFGDFQPSKAQVMAEREAARTRMRKHRNSRGSPEVTPNFARTSPEVQKCSPEVRGPRTRKGITPTAAGPTQDHSPAAAAAAAAADQALTTRLSDLGFGATETEAALAEPKRAWAWIRQAEHDATDSVGGYAWTNFSRGGWPSEPPPSSTPPEPDPLTRLLTTLDRWITSPEAHEYDEPAIRDELHVRARKAHLSLPDDETTRLIDAWHDTKPATTTAPTTGDDA